MSNDILNKKYQEQYDRRQNQAAKGYTYKPSSQPKKGMLKIKNGLNRFDTVTIPIAMHFNGQWRPFKVGFIPQVSNPKIGFYFNDGDSQILNYASVYQWVHENYVGKVDPDIDIYMGYKVKDFKIPFPDLQANDEKQRG